mgnify:CR=1 FL=1
MGVLPVFGFRHEGTNHQELTLKWIWDLFFTLRAIRVKKNIKERLPSTWKERKRLIHAIIESRQSLMTPEVLLGSTEKRAISGCIALKMVDIPGPKVWAYGEKKNKGGIITLLQPLCENTCWD